MDVVWDIGNIVVRMRLIFFMNIHKTIAWVGLVSSDVVNGVESRLPVMS